LANKLAWLGFIHRYLMHVLTSISEQSIYRLLLDFCFGTVYTRV